MNGGGRRGFLLKVLVSLGLLAALLARQPLEEIRAALAHPQWPWLLLALAVYGASAVAGVVPWAWLLRGAGSSTGRGRLTRLYLIGLFFNNFLPANVGGDIYKVIDLGRREHNPQRAFAATILDRLLGLAALTLVAILAAAVALGAGVAVPRVAWLLVLVLLALAVAGALLLSRRGAAGCAADSSGCACPRSRARSTRWQRRSGSTATRAACWRGCCWSAW